MKKLEIEKGAISNSHGNAEKVGHALLKPLEGHDMI